MPKRIILLIDMDAFFAQVEERENPHLSGKALVVGSDPKGGKGRGVVSTCNYQARKFGIKSGMPISFAWRKCPEAVFLSVDMMLYEKTSEKIMMIVKKYFSLMERVSLDEAYLDVSDCMTYKKAENLGKKIKKEILEKEKLTSTVGIGPNKTIAKMACNQIKPDGLLVITPAKAQKFLDPLDIEELPWVGPKSGEKIRILGVNTIRELRKISKKKLKEMFGKNGEGIYNRARGIDEEPIISERPVKSIGKEFTFEKDTREPEIIFKVFEGLIKEVYDEMAANNFSFKTITVVCRFFGFSTHTKSKTYPTPSKDTGFLEKEAKKLLLKFLMEDLRPLRLVGIRCSVAE